MGVCVHSTRVQRTRSTRFAALFCRNLFKRSSTWSGSKNYFVVLGTRPQFCCVRAFSRARHIETAGYDP